MKKSILDSGDTDGFLYEIGQEDFSKYEDEDLMLNDWGSQALFDFI